MKNFRVIAMVFAMVTLPQAVVAEKKVSLKRIEQLAPPLRYETYPSDGQWLSSSTDGKKFVAMSYDYSAQDNNSGDWLEDTAQTLYFYDLNQKKKFPIITTVNRSGNIETYQISRDGSRIFYEIYSGADEMYLYDTASNQSYSLFFSGGPFILGYPGRLLSAQMSPDGKYIAYTVEGQIDPNDNTYYVYSYLMNIDTGETIEIRTPNDAPNNLSEKVVGVTDAGKYVLIERAVPGKVDENYRLFLLNTETKESKEIDQVPSRTNASSFRFESVSYSNDGSSIAFVGIVDRKSTPYVYHVESDSVKRISCSQMKGDFIYSISISDSGDVALASGNRDGITTKVAVVDKSARSCKLVSKTIRYPGAKAAVSDKASISGDGKSIYFDRVLVTTVPGQFKVYRSDLILGQLE